MANQIVHFEVTGADIEKLQKFYTGVFDWDVKDSGMPGMDYRLIHIAGSDQSIGGMYQKGAEGPQLNGLLAYFGVDSVDDTAAKIQAAGGTILQPKMEIPGVGFMAVASDPDGNVFALFQG